MADMIADGAAWLAGQLQAHAAREILYVRGDAELTLDATIGQTTFSIEDLAGGQIMVEQSDRDFIVPAADLTFADEVVEPMRGDLVREVSPITGDTIEYEVLAPGGEKPFRYDSTGSLLRIHTKRVPLSS